MVDKADNDKSIDTIEVNRINDPSTSITDIDKVNNSYTTDITDTNKMGRQQYRNRLS